MSLAGLTHLFTDSTAKHTLQFVLSFGESASSGGRGRGRRGCLRTMLEIDQIVSEYHVDTPTAPLSGDLRAALRFFFDILGGIREGAWFVVTSTSRQRERSGALSARDLRRILVAILGLPHLLVRWPIVG